MKIADVLFLTLALVLGVSLASVWLYPSVQEFMAGNTMWNGIRVFAEENNVRQLDSLNALPAAPEKSAFISIPYLRYQPDEVEEMKRFVGSGGTLIIMDDFGYGNLLLESLGVEVRFDNRLMLDPLFCYKNQYFPLVSDFSTEVKDSGVGSLVLNYPSVLTGVDDRNALAWSSSASYLDLNENGTLDKNEPQGPFPVGAGIKIDRGTLYLISDTSLIINSMVDKNENYRFLHYLMSANGQPFAIYFDRQHLTKSPLDVNKMRMNAVREIVINPYMLVGIVAVVFVIITRYTIRKGESH